jgi:hypothetical protein
MASTSYIYNIINDFPNQAVDTARLSQEIQDSTIVIALDYINTDGTDCAVYFKAPLTSYDETSVLNVIIANHSGEALPSDIQQVSVESFAANAKHPVEISDEQRNSFGRLRVHQSSRPEGLAIHWSGKGDDTNDPHYFGGGENLIFHHNIGDSTSHVLYLDFNSLLNETWVHEVSLSWKNCNFDTVSVDVVPDTCLIEDSTSGNYVKYNDTILIPTTPGSGDANITSDIYEYKGGLVKKDVPSDPTVTPSSCFWNADWDCENDKFENLTAAPNGDGNYNIFYNDNFILNRLFNEIPLLGDGSQIFNSSDADKLTHGYRIRVTFTTAPPDHEWKVAATIVMHRKQVEEHFTVSDCDGNLISNIDATNFTIFVYDPNGNEVSNIISSNFVELGNGNYKYIFTPNLTGTWYVTLIHSTYFPWGKSDDIQVYNSDLTDIYDKVIRTLGLVHHNLYIDEPVYDDYGNMISARVRIYSDKNSVGTDQNVIETYLITSDGTQCGQFSFWSQVKI